MQRTIPASAQAAEVVSYLVNMSKEDLLHIANSLERYEVPELHNALSKFAILRSVATLALQEKKFPLK